MANIPFVSENFQRSFRNTFPSQTSTGRDLHVSDVVIPVVDFTPTASGTSLPSYMQLARNANSKNFEFNAGGLNTLSGVSSGFWSVDCDFKSTGNNYLQLFIQEGGTSYTITTLNGLASATLRQDRNFTMFIPVGYAFISFGSITTGAFQCDITCTQIADVNGNLTEPFGYFPQ